MLDWHGSGMSVMEMSHRGKEFMSIHAQAMADLREGVAWLERVLEEAEAAQGREQLSMPEE